MQLGRLAEIFVLTVAAQAGEVSLSDVLKYEIRINLSCPGEPNQFYSRVALQIPADLE